MSRSRVVGFVIACLWFSLSLTNAVAQPTVDVKERQGGGSVFGKKCQLPTSRLDLLLESLNEQSQHCQQGLQRLEQDHQRQLNNISQQQQSQLNNVSEQLSNHINQLKQRDQQQERLAQQLQAQLREQQNAIQQLQAQLREQQNTTIKLIERYLSQPMTASPQQKPSTVSSSNKRDCSDWLTSTPGATNGIYSIQVKGQAVQVYCDMTTTGGGWTVFQRRRDGSRTFYRGWTDYTAGFGLLNSEFWLGNDNLGALTAIQRYQLRVDLGDWRNNYRYAVYDNFKVGDASTKYRLTSLGTYSGNAGDSLAKHLSRPFSTYDQNNDEHNCAVTYRGAWWYNNCHDSNLNGEYNNTNAGKGVNWRRWLGHMYSLRFTEMKIRPF